MTIKLLQFIPDPSTNKLVPQTTVLNTPPLLASFCLANNAWPEVLFLDGTFYGLTTWSGKESAEYEKTLGFDLNACKEAQWVEPAKIEPTEPLEPNQSGETPA